MAGNCIYINIFLRYDLIVFIIYDTMLWTLDILMEEFKVFQPTFIVFIFEYSSGVMLFHAYILYKIQKIKIICVYS